MSSAGEHRKTMGEEQFEHQTTNVPPWHQTT